MTAPRAIAIVGLAGRFPDAPDVPTLFANVLARASASREVPEARWPAPRADMIDREGPPDRARSSRACLLEPYELTRIDLPAELVSRLSPLAKLTLSVGVDAFENAALGSLDKNRIGIVLANIALPTDGASKLAEDLFFEDVDRKNLGAASKPSPKADPLERHPSALPAGLLARALGLGGGSFTLDAACASSLYAIYLACEELATKRLDAVLTGGVSLPQALYTQVGFTQLQALSPSGTCSPFDQRADGLVVGEGAGMFVLRRLEDAERDGNRIYAVIRGIGLSNDVGGSLLSPDAEGQLRATRAAYAEAGWSPDDVELLECHGTGTARGDAVELASLTKLWEGLPARGAVLGSVKSNVGHLLTAAGAAGLCKVLAALEARTLPPSANFSPATAAPTLATSPFRVLERAEPWEPRAPGLPRRAAVSGFGFGGINAHVLVEEYIGPGTTLDSTGDVQVWGPSTALPPAGATAVTSPIAHGEQDDQPPRGIPAGSTAVTSPIAHGEQDDQPPRGIPAGATAVTSPIAVAIVGMGAHVGRLDSLTKLQHALLRGDPVRDARPEDRFCGLFREPLPGAWLDTFEMPLERFRIPPREMTSLLAQQLLMLKVAAEALDDARRDGAWRLGAGPHLRSGAIVGLGLDLETTTFHLRWLAPARVRAYAAAQGLSLAEAQGLSLAAAQGPSAQGFSLAAAQGLSLADAQPLSLAEDELEAWTARLADAMGPALDATRTLGALGGIVASRLAREFQLGGPSFGVSGEEGSGLRALEVAARMLQRGEADLMLAGAVDLAGDVRQVLATDALRRYSRTGRFAAFDADADGPVLAEGAAAVVLKRLDDAVRDGDRIYAVLQGFGAASGAALASGAARSGAYARAVSAAHREADIDPQDVSLVMAHGSGDPTEDDDEVVGLCRAFADAVAAEPRRALSAAAATADPRAAEPRRALSAAAETADPRAAEPRRALSAAAATLGHAGAASGLVSVVAASLALHEQMLPPMPTFRVSRRDDELAERGFHVPTTAQVWLRNRADGPRLAGVSTVGIDGTCLHAVLASAPESEHATHAASARPLGTRAASLFVCRGDEAALAARARVHRGDLESLAASWYAAAQTAPVTRAVAATSAEEPAAHDARPVTRAVAGTSAEEHDANPVTRAVVATSADELIAELLRERPLPTAIAGDVAFVFPGSGNHYIGMGRGLGAALPAVYRRLDAEVLHLAGHLMPAWVTPQRSSWDAGWEAHATKKLAAAPERMILGQVAHGIALSDAVRMFGVEPKAFLGYSLGESAGLFASRAWRDRDLMFRRTLSSPLFRTELSGPCTVAATAWGSPPDWRVAIVNRPAAAVRSALRGTAALLIVNAPDECVVGGRASDVAELVATLGCGAIDIEGVPTVHLPIMAPVAEAYRGLHVLPTAPPPGVRFYSGASGRRYEPTDAAAADSILANAMRGFDFPATVLAAYEDGARIFVELGPQGSCTRMIARILEGRPHLAVTACRRGEDGFVSLLLALAKLAEAGVAVDLAPIYGRDAGIATETPAPAKTLTLAVGRRRPAPPTPPARAEKLNVLTTTASAHAAFRELAVNATPPVSTPPALPVGARTEGLPSASASASVLMPSSSASAASVLTPSSSTSAAHGAFLELARRSMAMQSEALLVQQRLLERLLAGADAPYAAVPTPAAAALPTVAAAALPSPAAPAFDRAMCLEFATGSLATVLGPDFAAVDRHPTRVRLPAPPLMLCDRILTVEGDKGVLGPGRCVTEHDVLDGAWYLDAGRAPVCISVEAGQADLFLSAYLGIDFETKGTRVYRLLDARVVFHRDLPRVGETIRYDIRIDRFLCQGDTWLFFFRFDGTIAGAPFITMYDGCAGFFSDEQLASGRGIVDEAAPTLPPRRVTADGVEMQTFTPLVPRCRTALGAAQLEALRSGDLGAAFGAPFQRLTLAPTLRLPSGRMHLVDRIVELDTEGGAHGLGFVHGEADVTPDAWYLTCHFEGDPVMPGTLMYECCLHTLRVLLLRMGLIGEDAEGDALHYAPVEGVASRLRCRGQVLPTTKKVAYKVEITEIGYDPEPYVLANASMFSDGRHVVAMEGMSTRIRGLSRAQVEALWAARSPGHASTYTRAQILAYAEGNPSECFGPHYRVFDNERRIARLPRPPFLFVDRVVSCAPPPRELTPGGWVECELDVKPDAWYFADGRQMPFAILLEAGLQACGWLAAYVGSALTSDEDLKFRNLDGTATVFEEIGPDAGTLLLRTRMTKVSNAGGMLLQEFDFEVLREGRKVYVGHTGFGFFPAAALAAQVGLRGATLAPLPEGARPFELPREPLAAPKDGAAPPVRGFELPAGALLMVDRIDALELEGGPKRLGFVSGRKTVNPGEWFFAAHFYQDPVMPGSLGLEALLQLLKVFARERFGGLVSTHRAECMAKERPHRWQYRGQVLPTNREVTLQIHVTELVLGPEPLIVADGLLAVDGRVIYALHDLSCRLVPLAIEASV